MEKGITAATPDIRGPTPAGGYLLNGITEYIPRVPRTREDDESLVWNVGGNKKRTHCPAERFETIFAETLTYIMTTEHHMYMGIQRGDTKEEEFILWLKTFFRRNYPEMGNENDYGIMYQRLYTAVFQYYVLQPLIDHPDTSDIKVCRANDIRVRVKGKAYRSSAVFISDTDLYRFIEGLAIRNNLSFSEPMITFTDQHDKNYILRFLVNTPVVNTNGLPSMHVRKIPRVKPDYAELIKAEMLTPVVRDYLIDKAKTSKGIVFAGPPGSGKTTLLNAFIEYIPKTRETLVIQENDELFTDQSGFLFKHVTHGFKQGEKPITLEDLGKMALVEGCNEFIIGEVKGGEMRYVMTLLNAGGYSAFTVHSVNAHETMDKLADLVKYGSDYSFDDARKMLKNMDTIVYMEQYQVQEILEVVDYDLDTHRYVYRNIYKNEHPRWEKPAAEEVRDAAEEGKAAEGSQNAPAVPEADAAHKAAAFIHPDAEEALSDAEDISNAFQSMRRRNAPPVPTKRGDGQ